MSDSLNTPQPPPTEGEGPAVWPLILESNALVLPDWLRADMAERHAVGMQRYGTPLRVWNGRDAVVDAYQEALDLAVYARQARERLGRPAPAALKRPAFVLDVAFHQAVQVAIWLGELAREGKVPVTNERG